MSLAWQSLLLEVGCILQDVAEKKTHLVYKITSWCPSLEEHEHHTTIECIDKSCSTPLVARAKFLCVLSMSASMHLAAIMDTGRESPWEEGSCQVHESNERKVSITWQQESLQVCVIGLDGTRALRCNRMKKAWFSRCDEDAFPRGVVLLTR